MSKPSKERQIQGNAQASLNEVLEDYVMADGAPSRESLAEWVRAYPEYEQELTALTARWALVTHLPDVHEQSDVDEATLIIRGMSVVQSVLLNARQAKAPETADVASQSQPSTPIASFVADAARAGLTADALADRTGLSVSLVAKLDRRVVRADTIPRVVSERLAEAIRRDVRAVLNYSNLDAGFALAAEHRASQPPTLPAKLEDFFDAVCNDPELTDEQRAALLQLAKRDA